jgi:hypothetical protein
MADIKDSVGDGGLNRRADVTLIQALLKAAKTAQGHSYYHGHYDGAFTPDLKRAIIAFQTDQKLVETKKSAIPSVLNYWKPAPMINLNPFRPEEKAGLVSAKGKTIAKLNARVPPVYKDLRVLEAINLLHWESPPGSAGSSAQAIETDPGLDPGFRAGVGKLVRTMYARHKLTLWVAAHHGALRTFQEQYKAATKKPKPASGAGPGESNHNFGFAVDIGYTGLKWLHPYSGAIVAEKAYAIETMMKSFNAKFDYMFNLRNQVASGFGLFPTTYPNDCGHLQNFDDSHVNMRRSLAALLSLVGKHKWKTGPGDSYQCDLGLGGQFYTVGKSEQVWEVKALVTAQMLTQALQAAKKPVAAKPADVQAMQLKLKADLEAAEQNRSRWKPVP